MSTIEQPSLRVLLVEGDPSNCERITHVLETASHDVLPLSCIAEAQEALELQRFDVVLVPSSTQSAELCALAASIQKLELKAKQPFHIPIISYPGNEMVPARDQNLIEAVLPSPLEAEFFTRTTVRLAQQLRTSTVTNIPQQPTSGSSLTIFDELEFADQVCSDPELMVEIIDLYLDESQRQIEGLKACAREERLSDLSRLAHTLKGSLSSLHAAKARETAQQVELLAKAGDADRSIALLEQLLRDLSELEPVLKRFRNKQVMA